MSNSFEPEGFAFGRDQWPQETLKTCGDSQADSLRNVISQHNLKIYIICIYIHIYYT